MAELLDDLWKYNFCRIIVVDVSDDYRLMQPPMPSSYYPVLTECWLPRYNISSKLPEEALVTGYLYDWHETPDVEGGFWYVGMVQAELAQQLTSPEIK